MIIIRRMKQTFIQVSRFVAKWQSLKLNDADLAALESMLMANPEAGAVMAGAGGVRKVRFAPTLATYRQERRISSWIRLFPRW
jgi:hypothetical protein